LHAVRDQSGEEAATSRLTSPPGPKGQLEPAVFLHEVWHRMITTADAVGESVRTDTGVVDAVKPWQFGQEVAGEPGVRSAPAQGTYRHLQVVTAPAALPGPPRRGEAVSEQGPLLRLPAYLVPESRQQRLVTPAS